MQILRKSGLTLLCGLGMLSLGHAQSPTPEAPATPPPLTAQQVFENGSGSVAQVLAAGARADAPAVVGAALVIRQDGVLLTAYHLVRDARAVQVRLKSGEIFDQVQLLGTDPRRDVAAIRITASGLTVPATASAAKVAPGDQVLTIAHTQAQPWASYAGAASALRFADEVPGAGSGYRLLEFTAPTATGAAGGVLLDGQGRALGFVPGTINGGHHANFAVPVESVLGLADAPAARTFANGASLTLPEAQPAEAAHPHPAAVQPSKASQVAASTDREFILRNFSTMYVDCHAALHFSSDQLKAALARNAGFDALHIVLVDDPRVADTVLYVGYTFAWEFPFSLKHQGSSIVLLAGKGQGPLSGLIGANNVAAEFIKAAQPFRGGAPAQP